MIVNLDLQAIPQRLTSVISMSLIFSFILEALLISMFYCGAKMQFKSFYTVDSQAMIFKVTDRGRQAARDQAEAGGGREASAIR